MARMQPARSPIANLVEVLEPRTLMSDVSGSYSWQPVRLGGGGLVTGMVVSPTDANIRYVRTDVGNAYKWDVATDQWTPIKVRTTTGGVPATIAQVPVSGGVEGLAIDPQNPSTVYISFSLNRSNDVTTTYPNGQGVLLKSTDGGASFTEMNFPIAPDANGAWRGAGERMQVDPRNSSLVYYGSAGSGLWRSTNGGMNWTQLTSGGAPATTANVVGVRCYNTGSSTITYAIVAAGDVYKSTDGGSTWTNISTGTGLAGKGHNSALSPNGTLFVIQNGSRNIWRYNGTSWASADCLAPSNPSGVAVDPNNPNRVFALGQNGGLSRSLNGGVNWTKIADRTNFANTLGWLPQPVQPGWHGTCNIVFDRNGTLWMVQGNEGVLKFTPSATNTESTANPPQWTIESRGIEEFVTHDVVLPKGGGDKAIVAVEDATGLVIANPDTFTAKWIPLQDQLISNGNSVAYCPNDPNFLAVSSSDINWTGSHANYSGYSTDGGATWTRFLSHPDAIQTGTIAISRRGNWTVGSDHLVILPNNNQAPYYSKDGGKTWTQTTTWPRNADGTFNGYSGYWNLSLKQRQLKADPFVPDKYYLKFTSGGFWQSTDGGVNWTKLDDVDLPEGTHHGQLEVNHNVQNDLWFVDGFEGAYDPQTWSSAAAHGVWHSTNGGDTWTKLANVEHAVTIALGAGSGRQGAAAYSVYVYGKLSGDSNWGIFRSTNGGSGWDRVSYYPAGIFDQPTSMAASWDTFGLVYVGFGGNSFVYGKLRAPTVASTQISQGAAQRSMVKRLGVTFSEAVTVAPGAISVVTRAGQAIPNVTLNLTNPSGDGMTYVLTFAGTDAIGGSLPDGVYDLKITASGVTSLGGGTMMADYTQRFHRLFGDANGDRLVNLLDYRQLRTTLGRSTGQPLFNDALDYDNSGTVNTLDLSQFRRRFGMRLAY